MDNFPKIINYVRNINKRHQHLKNELFDVFSMDAWSKLSEKKKSMHSIEKCMGCLKGTDFKEVLVKLPIKSIRFISKANKAGLFKKKILEDITNV